jgi:predicted peptidase
MTSKLLDAELNSDLVPRDVEYSVIIPDGHKGKDDLPLILNLHGGGGSRERLKTQKVLGVAASIWISKMALKSGKLLLSIPF